MRPKIKAEVPTMPEAAFDVPVDPYELVYGAEPETTIIPPPPSTLPSQKEPLVGKKWDDGKLRFSLIPAGVVAEIVKVLMEGAAEYGDDNWKYVDNAKERYYNAIMRHLDEWRDDPIDKKSKLHHMAHICCSAMFIMWRDWNGTL